MLDLNQIAGARARTLGQDEAEWRVAAWSPEFQNLSARLTDGEVVDLLQLCLSASDLGVYTRQMAFVPDGIGKTPFQWLTEAAAAAGLTPGEWVRGRSAGELP